jgi:hypothetical protein
MGQPNIAGLQPWLPWPLSRYAWWTVPVPAERLAALRIGVAALLFVDIALFYLPASHVYFGRDSLADSATFAVAREAKGYWSAFAGIDEPVVLHCACLAWLASAVFLLVGCWPRSSAAFAWLLAVSFHHLNPAIHNGGDVIRIIALFYLMLSPCGAVWAVTPISGCPPRGPVVIAPWPLRLLFVQLTVVYFFNGVYKLLGPEWRAGDALHYVLADPSLSRFSYAELPLPYWGVTLLAWTVMGWELAFPILILRPWPRRIGLALGVAFHLGIALLLELNMFPFYMLCLYLPLLPWEGLSKWPSLGNLASWIAFRQRAAARL